MIDPDILAGFLVAAVTLTGSPGPNTLSLAATGAAFGVRRGLVYLVGLCAGMACVIAAVATGVTGVLLALPGAKPVLIGAAVAYFVYLAWRIATAPPLAAETGSGRQPGFLGGMLLSLVNPKAYAAMAALFSGFVLLAARPVLDTAAKAAIVLAVILAVNICWLGGGALLTRFFRDPRASRILNILFAILLLGSLAISLLI